MALLHGHPYLVRQALYLVASGQTSAIDLFQQAVSDRGPFGDHLRYHSEKSFDPAVATAARDMCMQRVWEN